MIKDVSIRDREWSAQRGRGEVVTRVSGTFCYPCLRAVHEKIGEPTGIRTLDLLIKSQLLYQLSYRLDPSGKRRGTYRQAFSRSRREDACAAAGQTGPQIA